MSSAILNSNASSALISATNAVSSITNPFIYSYGNKGQLTSSAVPAHARIVSTSQTSNIGFSQNIDFQVLKSSFLESAFIKYTIQNNSGAEAWANGLIGNLLLEEISLMTQGKIISHSTPFSRAARMSDAPYGRKKNLEQAYGLTAGEISIADGASKTFYVPLGLSCFDTPANFLNTSFLEPINIRIRTAGKSQYFGSHATPSVPVDLTMTEMELIQVFRMLDSAEEQKCIQANYSEDNLVSVEYDSICENTSFTPTAGLSRVASHVITTNRSIAKLYIAVENTVNPAAAVANTEAVGKYLELETIKISANGQEVLSVDAKFMGLCMGLDMGSGSSHNAVGNYFDTQHVHTRNIYCFDLTLVKDLSCFTGMISARELNQLKVEVTTSATTAVVAQIHNLHVAMICPQLNSVSSASGKITTSLSS